MCGAQLVEFTSTERADGQQDSAPIIRVPLAADEVTYFESGQGDADRLRTDLFLTGEICRRDGTTTVEPPQRRGLRQRQPAGEGDRTQASPQQADTQQQPTGNIAGTLIPAHIEILNWLSS
jgi:hypothetical protein